VTTFGEDEADVLRRAKRRTNQCAEGKEALTPAAQESPTIHAGNTRLRATSMDELVQLINILHCEMSLVGPRPHTLRRR
jgi:lipopolysaccharide/colanic/teichoic acid biosynthesis glycosyltransferase